jgi:hypothetical protein
MKITFKGELADILVEMKAVLGVALIAEDGGAVMEPRPESEEPVEETSRRSRPKSSGATAPSPSGDDISDADLGKAASAAAVSITPKVVTAIMEEEFGCTHVNDVKQHQRRAFLDRLAEATVDD